MIKRVKDLNMHTRRVRGSDAINRVIENPENGKWVSLVQHNDKTVNVRDSFANELFDGEPSESLMEIIFNALFGR